MKCEYLKSALEDAFLSLGGEESWLVFGLEIIPEKLKKIDWFINLLCHQPWKITSKLLIVH